MSVNHAANRRMPLADPFNELRFTKMKALQTTDGQFRLSERSVLTAIFAATFVTRLALAFRDTSTLVSYPFLDDTFYVLSVARNLALGHGLTIDGLHWTNGFHPLIVLLYAPIYWLANGATAIRLISVLSAALILTSFIRSLYFSRKLVGNILTPTGSSRPR